MVIAKKSSVEKMFFESQKRFGHGTRVFACGQYGFIIDWDIKNTFPLSGDFSILYDNGD